MRPARRAPRMLAPAAFALATLIGLVPAAAASAAPAGSTPVATSAPASAFAPAPLAGMPANCPSPSEPHDTVLDYEYWLEEYGVTEAWRTTRGAGTRIAIVDTGIASGPPEFAGAVAAGTDVSGMGTADGRTPIGAIDRNHGSWVASLAAARGDGETTMIGVAPEAELLSISVGFSASAPVPFSQQIAEAMVWAVDNGADVINLSLTTNTLDWDESWDDAFLYAFENDVVVVVAAGNRSSGTNVVGAPATIPGVLTVGGVDSSGRASVGASTQGVVIAVSAPSEELVGVSSDGRLAIWCGTSGAAPIVAGIAALVRSAHPDLDAANVINRIIKTATPAPQATSVPDALYGYGLVDAAAAVSASVPLVEENPMGSLADWIRIYRRADTAPVDEPPVEEFTVSPLPPAEPPTAAGSPLIPSRDTVLYGTVPLLAVTVPGILIGFGVTVAVRRVRAAQSSRVHPVPYKE